MREVVGKSQRQELFSFAAASVLEVRERGGGVMGDGNPFDACCREPCLA